MKSEGRGYRSHVQILPTNISNKTDKLIFVQKKAINFL